jgi:hypothetical protein
MTAAMLWVSILGGLCAAILMAAYLMPRLIR